METVVLSVAGVDPSAGAGLLADLETIRTHGARGVGVVSLLTVQSSRGVSRVHVLDSELVRDQLAALFEDLPIAAVKTGALGDAAVVRAVADALADFRGPIVVDPVACSSSGAVLLDDAGLEALRDALFPRATLVTPNLAEAKRLTGLEVHDLASMAQAAAQLRQLGPGAVLVKGGHLDGAPTDLWLDADGVMELRGERVSTRHSHGTGCAYASAIAARLALGESPRRAADNAHRWLLDALRAAPGLGGGSGPLELRAPPPPIADR